MAFRSFLMTAGLGSGARRGRLPRRLRRSCYGGPPRHSCEHAFDDIELASMRGVHQRGLAGAIVNAFDVGPFVEQFNRDLGITLPRGHHQWRHAVRILGIDTGGVLDQQGCDLGVPLSGCDVQRSQASARTLAAGKIGIGARIEQELDQLLVSFLHGRHQWSFTTGVGCIYFGFGRQQRFHQRCVTTHHRQPQWRRPL